MKIVLQLRLMALLKQKHYLPKVLKTCLKDMVILITRVMELKLKLYLMPKLPKVQILSCLVVVHWVAPSSIKLKMQEIFCLTKLRV